VRTRSIAAACAAAALPLSLSACSLTQSNNTDNASGGGPITVNSTNSACDVSSTTTPSGNLVFQVKNSGTKVTEFYLYGADGLRIVGEIENIGPGLTRPLVVSAGPGKYFTACKPGMIGQGIRAAFTVTNSGKSTVIKGVNQASINRATAQYAAYVKDQSNQLLAATRAFVTAYESGDQAKARELYPLGRQHYERIEPVAESFGDLDPKLDLREADVEAGANWTGWHRVEKDLWPPATGYHVLNAAGRARVGGQLLTDTIDLDKRVQTTKYSVDQIGNGSKGLLDEVATSKITGEEDIWSHTDLYDFQANIDGARVAYEDLKPLLDVKDEALSSQIGERFTTLQTLLNKYKVGDTGFVFYDEVTEAQRKELSDAVNALSEPLAQMTGAITL
jgi:iron uptake system component EfeO